MRILELFSGIGGLAAAVEGRAEVAAAVDHDLRAVGVYRSNWPHPVHVKNLVSVKPAWLAAFQADLWWMSPPCAPHGIRGEQRDVDDPRSAAFQHVLRCIEEVRPRHVAIENVPWFRGGRAWERLMEVAARCGYAVQATELCPAELGVPAVRRRVYVLLGDTVPIPPPTAERRPLSAFIGPWRDELAIPDDRRARFGDAFHVVDVDDPDALAACFTRAYGKSPVYVGSYLAQTVDGARRLRHFAPEEIARLYGFPEPFRLDLGLADGWKLIGNSVSVDAVRHVLRAFGTLEAV